MKKRLNIDFLSAACFKSFIEINWNQFLSSNKPLLLSSDSLSFTVHSALSFSRLSGLSAGSLPSAGSSTSSSLPSVSCSLSSQPSTLLSSSGLCPQGVIAAWRLIPSLAGVQRLSGEEDPNGRHVPVDCQAVEAGARLQRLPHLHHSAVQQPGELVEPLYAPLHDLCAGDGFGYALTARCEDDLFGERSARCYLLTLHSHASFLRRGPSFFFSSCCCCSGFDLHTAQSIAQQVADLAAVFDADLWSVWRKAWKRTDRRLLHCPSFTVVLHLHTEDRQMLLMWWTDRHSFKSGAALFFFFALLKKNCITANSIS